MLHALGIANTIGDYCALCIVAGYTSLMRRLTGLEAREKRRGGVSSAAVSRETPSGMSTTNVLSLCTRGGVSTIGVSSSAGASVSGYANTFDAVAAVCAGLSNIACRCFLFLLSTAPWSVSTRYDLGVLHCCCTFPVVLHTFSPSILTRT